MLAKEECLEKEPCTEHKLEREGERAEILECYLLNLLNTQNTKAAFIQLWELVK
jgi:hypothetical protein